MAGNYVLAGFGFARGLSLRRFLICARFEFALTLSAFGLRSAGAVLTGPGGSSPPCRLIRRDLFLEESPHGPFPCPRPLRWDSEELSGATAPPPRSGDIVACVSASGNAANKNSSPFVPAPALPASGYCSCHALHLYRMAGLGEDASRHQIR